MRLAGHGCAPASTYADAKGHEMQRTLRALPRGYAQNGARKDYSCDAKLGGPVRILDYGLRNNHPDRIYSSERLSMRSDRATERFRRCSRLTVLPNRPTSIPKRRVRFRPRPPVGFQVWVP